MKIIVHESGRRIIKTNIKASVYGDGMAAVKVHQKNINELTESV